MKSLAVALGTTFIIHKQVVVLTARLSKAGKPAESVYERNEITVLVFSLEATSRLTRTGDTVGAFRIAMQAICPRSLLPFLRSNAKWRRLSSMQPFQTTASER